MAVVAGVAFFLVWLINWARSNTSGHLEKTRILLVLLCFVSVGVVAYTYIRRQWLKYVRQQAVAAAADLAANLQAYEQSSAAVLSLIQEVELVSRGYRTLFHLFARKTHYGK